ncbi:MAG TPA: hypothetical protein VGZ00_09320 [Candidatus Baltobacteraceae bacterium]|jgi:hypothetical protein|nr:hypothetical protein [Candidatus Baltobacteraceae bacterium]
MSVWREHFFDKYFAYRERYVAAIAEQAPARARLAILSEVARLFFATFACSLCAAILWTPTLSFILDRQIGVGVVLAGLCALATTFFAMCTVRASFRALSALRKFNE